MYQNNNKIRSDFQLIDVAFGGVFNRNHLMKTSDLKLYAKGWKQKNLSFVDCYTTYFKYPVEMLEHFKTEVRDSRGKVIKKANSVEKYTGSCYSDIFPLDIDVEGDINEALRCARHVASYIESAYAGDLKTVRFFFSGYKGFHIELLSDLFGFEPSTDLHETYKTIAKEIMGDIPFDASIYDKVRLWRLQNTINKKSGMFKIPLTVDEFFNLSVAEIQQLAKKERRGNFSDPNVQLNTDLHNLYLIAKEMVAEEKERGGKGGEEKRYKNVDPDSEFTSGDRHGHYISVAGILGRKGVPLNVALTACVAIDASNAKPPKGRAIVEKQVRDIYQRYNYPAENDTDQPIEIIPLADVPPPEPMDWVLEKCIPIRYPTTLYGSGGLVKSYLAQYFAVLTSLGNQTFLGYQFPKDPIKTLYLDWELDMGLMKLRGESIAKGLDLPGIPKGLLYYQPAKSLNKLLPDIQPILEGEGIGFLIIDSLGASMTDPDRVTGILELFNSLKRLDVAVLVIDHQSKLQFKDNYDTKTPYGSIYKENLSRSVFQMSVLEKGLGQSTYMLRHKKTNFGENVGDLVFDVRFREDTVQFLESSHLPPQGKDLKIVWEGISTLKAKGGDFNQSNIVEICKNWGLGRNKVLTLLKEGEGTYWTEPHYNSIGHELTYDLLDTEFEYKKAGNLNGNGKSYK
ncbi:MAG TPA: AAA family ATPase [Thermodesulfobacteriota bacterium]|nr:AAA family ATPase [Thermodesulfobacteriota bacterium]